MSKRINPKVDCSEAITSEYINRVANKLLNTTVTTSPEALNIIKKTACVFLHTILSDLSENTSTDLIETDDLLNTLTKHELYSYADYVRMIKRRNDGKNK